MASLSSGANVRVATAITVSETERYQDLGSLDCTSGPLLDCEVDLRNAAAGRGAEVIVIETRSPAPCDFDASRNCPTYYARAYRKRGDG